MKSWICYDGKACISSKREMMSIRCWMSWHDSMQMIYVIKKYANPDDDEYVFALS